MLLDDEAHGTPTARWIERHDEGGSANDYFMCAAPISGGDRLRRLLWNRASGVVLTSATLSSFVERKELHCNGSGWPLSTPMRRAQLCVVCGAR